MITVVGVLLGIGLTGLKVRGIAIDLRSLWNQGLGDTQLWATALATLMRKLSYTSGFFFATFCANISQVLVSALYLLHNNLLTALLVSVEWNDFATERKTLRTSCPRGIQRSKYFLSLPYKYSITLMVCSGLLHWLISQSIFVIQTIGYTAPDFEADNGLDASIIGYSCISIMLSMMLGGSMVIALVLIGFLWKYKPAAPRTKGDNNAPRYPMPLVSTCSAAISVACHRHPEDKDAHLLPLRWGYVTNKATDEPGKGRGRFCFSTAREIRYPSALEAFEVSST